MIRVAFALGDEPARGRRVAVELAPARRVLDEIEVLILQAWVSSCAEITSSMVAFSGTATTKNALAVGS